MSESEWRDEARMLERICTLLAPPGRDAIAAAAARARDMSHATFAQMAQATFALYERALANADAAARPTSQPIEPGRLRHALGYVPWLPPPPSVPRRSASSPGFLDRVARAAAGRRNTFAGRILFRLAPSAVVAALRARLK